MLDDAACNARVAKDKAMNRLFSSLGFKIHFAAYALVNLLLLAVNLLTTPNHLWFYWPLLGFHGMPGY